MVRGHYPQWRLRPSSRPSASPSPLPVLGGILLGLVLGLVFGAVPGLNAVLGIVLLLPFVWTLSPFVAFAIMLSLVSGGAYLQHVPGLLLQRARQPQRRRHHPGRLSHGAQRRCRPWTDRGLHGLGRWRGHRRAGAALSVAGVATGRARLCVAGAFHAGGAGYSHDQLPQRREAGEGIARRHAGSLAGHRRPGPATRSRPLHLRLGLPARRAPHRAYHHGTVRAARSRVPGHTREHRGTHPRGHGRGGSGPASGPASRTGGWWCEAPSSEWWAGPFRASAAPRRPSTPTASRSREPGAPNANGLARARSRASSPPRAPTTHRRAASWCRCWPSACPAARRRPSCWRRF